MHVDPTAARKVPRRVALRYGIAGLAVSTALLAGCTSTTGATGATAQVKKDWVEFFAPTTSSANKLGLLENGTQFAPVLRQLGSMASSVSSTVQKVKITSPSTATVTYSLLLGATPVLTAQKGEAVKQDGVWKVSDASLCSLLALEHSNAPACSGTGATGSSG